MVRPLRETSAGSCGIARLPRFCTLRCDVGIRVQREGDGEDVAAAGAAGGLIIDALSMR